MMIQRKAVKLNSGRNNNNIHNKYNYICLYDMMMDKWELLIMSDLLVYLVIVDYI